MGLGLGLALDRGFGHSDGEGAAVTIVTSAVASGFMRQISFAAACVIVASASATAFVPQRQFAAACAVVSSASATTFVRNKNFAAACAIATSVSGDLLYDPRSAGTVILDWDPYVASTITVGSGTVSSLFSNGDTDDGKRLQQATAGAQPTYNAADSNYGNNPTLGFDGLRSMVCNSNIAGAPVAQPFTVFFVGNNTVAGKRPLGMGPVNAAPYLDTYVSGPPNDWEMNDSGERPWGAVNTTSINPSVLALVLTGSTSYTVYPTRKTAVNLVVGSANGITKLILGDRVAGGRKITGAVARVLIIQGALSDAVVKQVVTSLGARYGITLGA